MLEEIRQKAPIPHIAFWIEPVEGFGRLSTIPEALPTVKTPEDHAAIGKEINES